MLALDFLLIILTSACIVYCMVLNRRIIQIQRYRAEMLKIFKEFDKSIAKAELILQETKQIAPKADDLLKSLEKRLGDRVEELELLLDKGDRLGEELETIIISGSKLAMKLAEIQEVTSENNHQPPSANEENNEYNEEEFRRADGEQIKLSQQDYYEMIQSKRRIRK